MHTVSSSGASGGSSIRSDAPCGAGSAAGACPPTGAHNCRWPAWHTPMLCTDCCRPPRAGLATAPPRRRRRVPQPSRCSQGTAGAVTVLYRTDWQQCTLHWADATGAALLLLTLRFPFHHPLNSRSPAPAASTHTGEWRSTPFDACPTPGWRSVTVQVRLLPRTPRAHGRAGGWAHSPRGSPLSSPWSAAARSPLHPQPRASPPLATAPAADVGTHALQAETPVEFVLTDEEGVWDNAPGASRNYVAPSPGQYKLHNSDLVLLPPNVPCLLVRTRRVAGQGAAGDWQRRWVAFLGLPVLARTCPWKPALHAAG